jgi:hypothetical protein
MMTRTGNTPAQPTRVEVMAKDGIKFKKLSDALAAFDRGELPKGTKLFVGATTTILARRMKNTQDIFYKFEGTPSEFVRLVLGKLTTTKIKVEVEELPSTITP